MDDAEGNHVIEFSSASGVVYMWTDQEPFVTQRFSRYVKICVILDDKQNCDELCQDGNETALKVNSGSHLPIQFGNLSSDVSNMYSNDIASTSRESMDIEDQMPNIDLDSDDKESGFVSKVQKSEEEKIEKKNVLKRSQNCIRVEEIGLTSIHCDDLSMKTRKIERKSVISDQGKPSKAKSKLQQIAPVRSRKGGKDVFCKYCSKSFQSRQEFYDHRKSKSEEHCCDFCQKVFPFKAHLLVHRKTHDDWSPGDSIDCDQTQSKSKTNEIKCDICGAVVSTISVLKTHLMRHTGENAYKCCVCNEQFNSIGSFSHHLKTHWKTGKVQCKICNVGFENRRDLSKHQLMHDFKCSLCGALFPNKTSRAFHYKVSHREDILRCPECTKLFSSDADLQLHLKYHQNRKKTQCTICGRLVSRLSDHMLSHSSRSEECGIYVCDKCPRQFKQKLCFQRHLKTHSEEKLYACIHCPKRFSRSGGLSRHMLTHTQEKPFRCSVCGKTCTQIGNLKSHMQVHKDINF